ncbi:CBL-interacting serine/threonine-protein kinase 11 [Acorus calamus]|uniref:CBL-interacting serine/threonine-protein kinase 11 n=1 Tax=Acorus calamus TaxID=4465 RepID=A0AAV9EEK6_ACOCL|nr:CBL-interacting serine/threonine-protein kinase 11 [Acorus calamus]
MEKLGKKLQNSLLSEIYILRKINHPNIIRLHDMIEAPGRIYLVLEYCSGGDLSIYVQRHGRVNETVAKHFMQQLATGLKVLRENNLMHRDLKPQNLLLATNDDQPILKLADFGFARSLQPRGLAETVCGSPLYMAPEIMQLQKYDAKADLWSVGAILFQLVMGRTPFTGHTQLQLLQNILKSNELRFPPDTHDLSSNCIDLCQKLLRRNPVERLTFEEFFNHPFLSQNASNESVRWESDCWNSRASSMTGDCFPMAENIQASPQEDTFQEDCLPFLLDDESSGQDGSLSVQKTSMRSTYGFCLDNKVDNRPSCSDNMSIASRYSIAHNPVSRLDSGRPSFVNHQETKIAGEQSMKYSSKVADSLEFIDQDYVLVSGPPTEVSSSFISASQPRNSPCKSENSPIASPKINALSSPMPIIGAVISNTRDIGSLDSRSTPPSGTSQGSTDMGDALEQPSANPLTRIRSLQECACAITELVNERLEAGKHLEAFSVQLVILAVWKQALHICHAQAASALEGSPSPDVRYRGSTDNRHNPNVRECRRGIESRGPAVLCSQIERDFLQEVCHAEELARDFGRVDETSEMPDAMEIIFQSALALGRHGGVEELMDNMESAAALYTKAVRLLSFLLIEAPSLILNPPFSLTSSDRFRLRTYIDILNNRQGQSRSHRMAMLKCDDQQSF